MINLLLQMPEHTIWRVRRVGRSLVALDRSFTRKIKVSLDPIVKTAILEERLEGHEKICAERYGEISKSFDRIHGRLDWIMRGVISLLAAMLGWVIVKGVPWPAG